MTIESAEKQGSLNLPSTAGEKPPATSEFKSLPPPAKASPNLEKHKNAIQ